MLNSLQDPGPAVSEKLFRGLAQDVSVSDLEYLQPGLVTGNDLALIINRNHGVGHTG